MRARCDPTYPAPPVMRTRRAWCPLSGAVPFSPALSNNSCNVAPPGRCRSCPMTNRATPRTVRTRMPDSSTRRTSERTRSGSADGIATSTSVTWYWSATANTSDSVPRTGRPSRNTSILSGSSSTKPMSSTPWGRDRASSRLMESPCSPAPAISIRWVGCASRRAEGIGRATRRWIARRFASATCHRRNARIPTQENSVSSTIRRTVDIESATSPVHLPASSTVSRIKLQVVMTTAS